MSKVFKKITISDIAKLANVSKTTVSRVLSQSNLVNKETQNNVLKIIKKYNFQPSIIARSLKTRKTKTIGVILADIDNPFYSRIAKGIIDTAERANYNVIICSSNFNVQKEENSLEVLIGREVDGLLITTVELKKKTRERLLYNNIPFVLIDYKLDIPNIGYVVNDDYYGGQIATEYLISLGHKKIFFLGNINLLSFKDRYRAVKDTLKKNGLDSEEIVPNIPINIDTDSEILSSLIKRKKNITGIFVASDKRAINAINVINGMGLSVPEDISIIGYDDIDISKILRVPLTTIRQPKYRLGKLATEQLLEIINGSSTYSKIVLRPELIIRESCRSV